jgi:hypothetical protein
VITGTPTKPVPEKLVDGSPSIITYAMSKKTGIDPTMSQMITIMGNEIRYRHQSFLPLRAISK